MGKQTPEELQKLYRKRAQKRRLETKIGEFEIEREVKLKEIEENGDVSFGSLDYVEGKLKEWRGLLEPLNAEDLRTSEEKRGVTREPYTRRKDALLRGVNVESLKRTLRRHKSERDAVDFNAEDASAEMWYLLNRDSIMQWIRDAEKHGWDKDRRGRDLAELYAELEELNKEQPEDAEWVIEGAICENTDGLVEWLQHKEAAEEERLAKGRKRTREYRARKKAEEERKTKDRDRKRGERAAGKAQKG